MKGGGFMRWRSIVTLLMTFVFATIAAQGVHRSAQAQDATPPAEQQAGTPTATMGRVVASGSIELLAPGTATLVLGRVNLAPGAVITFDPMDPSVDLLYVTSGELTLRVEAPMTVARSVRTGTPVPPVPEEIAANTEFTMRDGDSALFPPSTAGEMRNDGDEDAIAWVTNVALLIEAAGTPTP
jgi:quercetin dioxygenase-like cupin family protein